MPTRLVNRLPESEAKTWLKEYHLSWQRQWKRPATIPPKTRAIGTRAGIAQAKLALKQEYQAAKLKLRSEYQEALRQLRSKERLVDSGPEIQLERLRRTVGGLRECCAQELLYRKGFGRISKQESPQMRKLYRDVWYFGNRQQNDWHGWEKLLSQCKIPLAITLNKQEVAAILGYSLAGLDRLRKRGLLPFQQPGHRTVMFVPKDVEDFIKSTRKWMRSAASKEKI